MFRQNTRSPMCVKTMPKKKISIRINAKAKENKTRHIIFKFKKIKDKGKILKGVRGKKIFSRATR